VQEKLGAIVKGNCFYSVFSNYSGLIKVVLLICAFLG
jgi:hypothetical protein